MADPQEPGPRRPPPSGGGKPLQRLWKADPEPEEAPDPPPKKPKKGRAEGKADRKGKKKAEASDGGPKGALIEETPALDTYESRQRARILVGVALTVFLALVGYGVYARFAPEPVAAEPSTEDLLAAVAASGNLQDQKEKDARVLFERAREVAKAGKADTAASFLAKVEKQYPGTKAAQEAHAVLERPKQNLPLFHEGPPEAPGAKATAVAVVVGPAPAPAPAPMPAVAAPTPPAVVLPVVRPLPAGFHAKPGSATHASGWPLAIVGDRDGAPLVLVPGGTFTQGRDDADPAEGPAHLVRFSTFYVDQHEVTVRQFNVFQREAGRRADRTRALARDGANAPAESNEFPVVMVSARDAKDYADWAGKRLPTEAQWEAAARAPDNRLHPWGMNPLEAGKAREPRKVGLVASFPEDVTPLGVFDLAGNAWEWTKDWYDARFYQQARAGAPLDPTGPLARPRSLQLTVKGGDKEGFVTKREGLKFETRLPYLGFRCVLPVEGAGNVFEPAAPAGQAPAPGAPNGPLPGANGELVPF